MELLSRPPAVLVHRGFGVAPPGHRGGVCEAWRCGLAAATAPARCRFEAVLCDALGGQLRQNVVQVVWVGVAVARQVGHHLRFVVDAVPHHRVGLAGGARRSHSEDEAPHPRHLQQLQHLFRETGGGTTNQGGQQRNFCCLDNRITLPLKT